MTSNYQLITKVHDALLAAIEGGDCGAALTNLMGIPITYNPDATYEFTINGQPYFYDDDVYPIFLELMGLDPDDEKEALREAFENHDETADKVVAYVFRRVEYQDVKFAQQNGVWTVSSDLNGPNGTYQDLVSFLKG